MLKGKAAFMRVVSKHMEEGEEGEEGESVAPASSTAAQIQARLGFSPQRQPLSRPQPVLGQGQLGSGVVLPPEASAQRFTDWRSQSQRKTGAVAEQARGSSPSPEVSGAAPNLAGGSGHAFSRAGIQQTIDNVRNKWFSGGSNDSTNLLVGPGLDSEDQADGQESSFRLHDNDLLMLGGSPRLSPNRLSTSPHAVDHPSQNHSESFGLSQPKRAGSVPRQMPSPAPQAQQRRASDSAGEAYDPQQQQYQEYDSSLDKLNSSLSDLQGEIMRLSLQHEQGKVNGMPPSAGDPRLSSALSAIGSTAGGTVHQQKQSAQLRPIHGIPQQAGYVNTDKQQLHDPPATSVPYNQHQQRLVDGLVQTDLPSASSSQQQHSKPVSKRDPAQQQQSVQNQVVNSQEEVPQSKEGGFFVSFGDDSSPKRAKPRLGEHRSTPTAQGTTHTLASSAGRQQQQLQQQQQNLWVQQSDLIASPELDPGVAAVVASQAVAPLTPASKGDLSGEDKGGSPSVGFVIQDQSSKAVDPVSMGYFWHARLLILSYDPSSWLNIWYL